MSEVLQLKRDPSWLKSLPHIDDTLILLQGDDPDRLVPVTASLLVAISPLVRNILANGHLPPAFSTTVISIPSVTVDILESVGEMLVSGSACMDMTRLCGVREVFSIIGIEDLMVIQEESNFGRNNSDTGRDVVQNAIVDDLEMLENFVDPRSEEIVVKIEKELEVESSIKQEDNLASFVIELKISENQESENPLFLLNQAAGNSCKSGLELEKNKDKTVTAKPLKTSIVVQKKMQVRIARLQIMSVQVQCLQCNERLAFSSLQKHIEFVHEQTMMICPQCNKKMCGRNLSMHIRRVHNKETTNCPHCDKTLSYTSLKEHIKYIHEQTLVQCPQCNKSLGYSSMQKHIKFVHGQTMVTCPQCDKGSIHNSKPVKVGKPSHRGDFTWFFPT